MKRYQYDVGLVLAQSRVLYTISPFTMPLAERDVVPFRPRALGLSAPVGPARRPGKVYSLATRQAA